MRVPWRKSAVRDTPKRSTDGPLLDVFCGIGADDDSALDPRMIYIVRRGAGIPWLLMAGPHGERWICETKHRNLGKEAAYFAWWADDAVRYRQDRIRADQMQRALKNGQVSLAFDIASGPTPLILLEGGKA